MRATAARRWQPRRRPQRKKSRCVRTIPAGLLRGRRRCRRGLRLTSPRRQRRRRRRQQERMRRERLPPRSSSRPYPARRLLPLQLKRNLRCPPRQPPSKRNRTRTGKSTLSQWRRTSPERREPPRALLCIHSAHSLPLAGSELRLRRMTKQPTVVMRRWMSSPLSPLRSPPPHGGPESPRGRRRLRMMMRPVPRTLSSQMKLRRALK
mmetsp:Transcript_24833/g.61903  ORF Transcript_24833/g.61903 Transcript_24833/m.61903 type:complete len:207 (-) Transcript_24833:144-764(-)